MLALVNNPDWLDDDKILANFAPDVVERARRYVEAIPGGTGAYSHSMGVEIVRKEVAEFISARDGYPSDPESIFITDGASQGVQMTLKMLIRNKDDGVMIPIPQYPLYTAGLALNGGTAVPYYLDEGRGWGCDLEVSRRDPQPVTLHLSFPFFLVFSSLSISFGLSSSPIASLPPPFLFSKCICPL